MNISEIAEYVWDNSQVVCFGNTPQWDTYLFKDVWRKNQSFSKSWKEAGAGWYWFISDMTYDELHSCSKPATLPDKGCNIGLLSHENREIFGDALLCTPIDSKVVIYNGHESNVTARLRSHFALNNNQTGAIGLKHYPLSNKNWQARYFSTPCFTASILIEEKKQIELLMKSYSGRCAVESSWRVSHGWPILCKE